MNYELLLQLEKTAVPLDPSSDFVFNVKSYF